MPAMISAPVYIDKYQYQTYRPPCLDWPPQLGAISMTEHRADAIPQADAIHDEVRARYAQAALSVIDPANGPSDALASNARPDATTCCGDDCCAGSAVGGTDVFGSTLYSDTERGALPDAAVLASLGCGNPTAVAELREGETVLDLGSGGGIDVLLSARRVGPTGRAIGVDMTDEMLILARRNAADAGATNVEFVKGTIEALPLPADSVDVVISNCVINLAADKQGVLREIARVLRPGGRVGVSDVVARDDLSPSERAERGSYAGCIAGALSFAEYEAGLRAAGLTEISVRPTHEVADGMFAAIVRATKPG
jgi:SAM-dependent methyltransferase